MESMGKKPRRRRSFTPEFKAEIVELCQRGERSVGQVARDFDLTEIAVREWVKQAERDAGTGDGGLTSDERRDLAELRKENALRGPAHRHQPPARLARGLGRLVARRHPPVPCSAQPARAGPPAAGGQRNHPRPDAGILSSPGKSPAAQEPGTATRNALEARLSRGAGTTRKPGSQGRAAQQCAALTRPWVTEGVRSSLVPVRSPSRPGWPHAHRFAARDIGDLPRSAVADGLGGDVPAGAA